jgi:hypothetical protein
MSKDCILIGGGRSVLEGISLDLWQKIKDREIWSLNFAYKTIPYLPKKQLWIDVSFFTNNIIDIQELYGNGVECIAKSNQKYSFIPEIKKYNTTRDASEVNNNKMFIGKMGLVGFFALSLATKEKYDRIFLLGFDFGTIEGDTKTHYYQDTIAVKSTGINHPELYKTNNNIKKEVEDFEIFLKEPSKIYNVSPKSNIPYFEKINYTEFFKLINVS